MAGPAVDEHLLDPADLAEEVPRAPAAGPSDGRASSTGWRAAGRVPPRRSPRSGAPHRGGGHGRARHVQVVAPRPSPGQPRHRTPVSEAEQKEGGGHGPRCHHGVIAPRGLASRRIPSDSWLASRQMRVSDRTGDHDHDHGDHHDPPLHRLDPLRHRGPRRRRRRLPRPAQPEGWPRADVQAPLARSTRTRCARPRWRGRRRRTPEAPARSPSPRSSRPRTRHPEPEAPAPRKTRRAKAESEEEADAA